MLVAPPNARKDGHSGEFILNAAARLDGRLVLALLEAGAFPNVADEHGWTALHSAVEMRRTGAVAALVEAGADPRAGSDLGVKPIDLIRPEDAGHGEVARDIRDLLYSAYSRRPSCGAPCDAQFWKTATPRQIRNSARPRQLGRFTVAVLCMPPYPQAGNWRSSGCCLIWRPIPTGETRATIRHFTPQRDCLSVLTRCGCCWSEVQCSMQ